MEYAVIIILLSLLQYTSFAFAVGTSRIKHNVAAPNITGNEIWEDISGYNRIPLSN